MTAIQLAPPPAPPLPGRTDWQGVCDAIELFILERRADKKQPSTIRYYRQQLGLFRAWLTQQDVPGDGPEDVTKALILAYRLHLQERGHTRLVGQPLQHTTLVASQRAVRTFFAWAEEEGYVIDGRILKLRKTRVPQKDATVYTLAQMDAILAACASPTEELAIRFVGWNGVRLSEAVGVCLRGPDGLPDLETDNLGRGCATLRVRWDAGAKGLKDAADTGRGPADEGDPPLRAARAAARDGSAAAHHPSRRAVQDVGAGQRHGPPPGARRLPRPRPCVPAYVGVRHGPVRLVLGARAVVHRPHRLHDAPPLRPAGDGAGPR